MRAGLSNLEVAEIYKAYGYLLLRRCRTILRNDALAEDVFQEALIKIMRYGAQYRDVTAKLRWLYRACDRCCFDHLSRSYRRREIPSADKPAEVGVDLRHRMDARHRVMRILSQFGDEDRQIAVFAFVDEMNQSEIAQELGKSRQTVNKRLQSIRKKARLQEDEDV